MRRENGSLRSRGGRRPFSEEVSVMFRRSKQQKLPYRKKVLIAFFLITTCLLGMFALFSFAKFSNEAKRTMLRSMQDNLDNMTVSIEQAVSDTDYILSSVHADKNVQAALSVRDGDMSQYSAMAAKLQYSLLNSDIFRRRAKSVQLFSFDSSGYPNYTGSSIYSNLLYNCAVVSEQAWYKETLKAKGTTCWFYNTEDPLAGENTLFATRCVVRITAPSEQIGMIRVVIRTRDMSRLLHASAFEGGAAALCIDGHYLTEDGTELPEESGLRRTFDEMLEAGENSVSGGAYVAACRDIPGTQWKVFLAVPARTVRAASYDYLLLTLGVVFLLALLAFLFSHMLSAYLLRPINDLCSHMDEFNTRLQLDVPQDSDEEISRLYSSFNAMSKKIDGLIAREKSIEKQKQAAEMRALQAQINPHFIYNTLESIRALAIRSHADSVVEMTTAFGTFLRGSLNYGRHYTTIQDELTHVRAYVEIQKIRFQNAFSFTCTADPRVQNYLIPNLTVQPLIENCILHGLDDLDGPGLIELDCRPEGEQIVLSVSDNGCGADLAELERLSQTQPADMDENRYYCLRNIRIRLEHFFQHAELHFSINDWGGLTVTIRFEQKLTVQDPD